MKKLEKSYIQILYVFFANDEKHLKWITKMTNVLFSTDCRDFKKIVDLRLNEEEVYNFAVELKKKWL